MHKANYLFTTINHHAIEKAGPKYLLLLLQNLGAIYFSLAEPLPVMKS